MKSVLHRHVGYDSESVTVPIHVYRKRRFALYYLTAALNRNTNAPCFDYVPPPRAGKTGGGRSAPRDDCGAARPAPAVAVRSSHDVAGCGAQRVDAREPRGGRRGSGDGV